MNSTMAEIRERLDEKDWEILGYSEAEIDEDAGYHHDAQWDGVACKNGFLLLVDICEWERDYWGSPRAVFEWRNGTCDACKGTQVYRKKPCHFCEGTGRRHENRLIGYDPPIPYVRECPGQWMLLDPIGRVLAAGQLMESAVEQIEEVFFSVPIVREQDEEDSQSEIV